MSDLIDAPTEGRNEPEFSVSEISGAVKKMIEGEFGHVRVRGEIGRVMRAGSGHVYYDLKDDGAVLNAVTWKGQAASLSIQPEEGMEVVAIGKLTSYPRQSKYQMNVMELRVAGVGALMAMLEKRKKALAAEGLFDKDRKQPIPFLPEVIGVITSPSGAVIRDILHRLRDRFPRKVLIWPVAVQGDRCAPDVTAAIEGFNKLSPGGALPRPDLLIVARGGGSLEDLWGFNEESVARAAAASDIPLISAVGHETDTTLIDYASDLRAPTPTAAAEASVPVRTDLLAWLGGVEERRLRVLHQGIERRRQRLTDLARALPKPAEIVARQAQRLDLISARLPLGLGAVTRKKQTRLAEVSAGLRPRVLQSGAQARRQRLDTVSARLEQLAKRMPEDHSQKLASLSRVLETLSYKSTLSRGYAVLRNAKGRVLPTAALAGAEASVVIELQDGQITAAPTSTSAPTPAPTKKAKPKSSDDQGSLF